MENEEQVRGIFFGLVLLFASVGVFIAGLDAHQPIACAVVVAAWIYFLKG